MLLQRFHATNTAMTRIFSLFHSRHFGMTLLIAIATGLISMCGQVIWLYSQSQNNAQAQLSDSAKIMQAPATQALFELNLDMAHSVVSSLTNTGRVHKAQIFDFQRHLFISAINQTASQSTTLFPDLVQLEIPLKNTANSQILGYLILSPDRQYVTDHFWQAAGELAIIEFLRSFLVAFALALLFQFRIERPFQKLSRQILAADPSNPDHTLKLLKQSTISEQVGELGRSIEQFLLIAQQQLIEKNQALGRVEELERLQQQIQSSEVRYRSLISALVEGVIQQDQQGHIITFNAAALKILGLSAAQLQGQALFDGRWCCIHEDGSPYPPHTHPAMVTLATGAAINAKIMGIQQADGVLRWISINTQGLFSSHATLPNSVVTTFTDISATRATQLALQHAKDNAERYLQTAGVVMLVVDSTGNIQLANARAAQIIGLSVSQLVGMNYVENFTLPADQARLRGYLNRIFAGNAQNNTDLEGTIKTAQGQQRTMAWHNVCVHNEHGQVQSLLCSGEDITEAKTLQASLQLRSHLLEQLSTEQSFNDFMIWLCQTLQQSVPNLSASMLIPHNSPCILGANTVAITQLWQNYLDALTIEPALWPSHQSTLAANLSHSQLSHSQESATKTSAVDFSHILLEPIHHQPRALLGLIFDPSNPPNTDQIETIKVFTHIARLALERQAGNEQLQTTTLAALAASRAKSEFLANMSHEIRKPLNAVLGFSGLMQQTSLNHEQKEFIAAIHSSGNALLTLINDLLDYSKIEAGHLELEDIAFDLRRLVDDVVDIMAEKIQYKGLQLYTQIDAAFPEKIIGDPGRFRQILLNLINNACKFTASGHITLKIALISVQDKVLQLRCEVVDTGIGIDFANSNTLFQPFIQADNSTTRQFGGTGLGLSICRRLVEAMAGEIGVESQLGYGATFWFTASLGVDNINPAPWPPHIAGVNYLAITDQPQVAKMLQLCLGTNLACIELQSMPVKLPKAIPMLCIVDILEKTQAQQIDLQIQQQYPDCAVIRLVALHNFKALREHAPLQIQIPRPIRRKLIINATEQLLTPNHIAPIERRSTPRIVPGLPILLVEDNPINQRVASLILQNLGCIVTVANNGIECLAALATQDFALILMDCQMPVMDGFTATRAIRALPHAKSQLPIVALTSNAFQEDRDACLAAGMNDFVTKPVTALALNEVITRWAQIEHHRKI